MSLGLEPRYRKIDNFKQIQNRIYSLFREQRVTPVLWIDEAQYLHHSILADFKMLMNFEMDSRNYAIMILSGLPSISTTLSLKIHEALVQRIVIHYTFGGISGNEIKEYIESRLSLCGVNKNIFEEVSYEVMSNYCNGSIRKLDNLIHKALMIGCSNNKSGIDKDTMMEATCEVDFV